MRFSAVMWLTVPSWSSAPKRPQFETRSISSAAFMPVTFRRDRRGSTSLANRRIDASASSYGTLA